MKRNGVIFPIARSRVLQFPRFGERFALLEIRIVRDGHIFDERRAVAATWRRRGSRGVERRRRGGRNWRRDGESLLGGRQGRRHEKNRRVRWRVFR